MRRLLAGLCTGVTPRPAKAQRHFLRSRSNAPTERFRLTHAERIQDAFEQRCADKFAVPCTCLSLGFSEMDVHRQVLSPRRLGAIGSATRPCSAALPTGRDKR